MAPLWVAFQANLGTLLRTCDAVGACIAVPDTPALPQALAPGDTLGARRRPCIHWVRQAQGPLDRPSSAPTAGGSSPSSSPRTRSRSRGWSPRGSAPSSCSATSSTASPKSRSPRRRVRRDPDGRGWREPQRRGRRQPRALPARGDGIADAHRGLFGGPDIDRDHADRLVAAGAALFRRPLAGTSWYLTSNPRAAA